MQYFKVTVNGKSYEVSVEELPATGQAPVQTVTAAAPEIPAAPAAAAAETPRPAAPAEVPAGEELVPAPLGGTIVELKVKPGDQVNKGQVLLILEALKMENEIVAPANGIVSQIFVRSKDTVNAGDALLTLRS